MSWPAGSIRNGIRGRAWDAPRQRPARLSIEVMHDGRLLDRYERSEESPAKAIDAVVVHLRFMVKHGCRPAGLYRFLAVGSTDYREVRLTSPKRARR